MSHLATRDVLRRLLARENLERAEVEELFGELMDGRLGDATKAALLIALAMKGETTAEIAGAALAMRRRVVRIPHARPDAVDTCGTGGDGRGSFNVSTAAALVAAAAGVPVAKHGNRSVSSRSGSADVLAAAGVEVEISPEEAGRALDELGIAFLFAPKLHPAMKEVMPVRRELGVRTLFNVLGPLTNPAGARRQVMGVYARHLVERLAEVLLELGAEHALVVHGSDGLDEITTTGPTAISEVRGGRVQSWELDPQGLGIALVRPEDLRGASPEENAATLEFILGGEGGPLAEIVALNAGAAIWVGGLAGDLAGGLAKARAVLASGAAAEKLDALRRFSQG